MQTPMLETLLIAYARHFPVRRGKLRVVNSLWRAAGGEGALPTQACISLLESHGYRFAPAVGKAPFKAVGPWLRKLDDVIAAPAERAAL